MAISRWRKFVKGLKEEFNVLFLGKREQKRSVSESEKQPNSREDTVVEQPISSEVDADFVIPTIPDINPPDEGDSPKFVFRPGAFEDEYPERRKPLSKYDILEKQRRREEEKQREEAARQQREQEVRAKQAFEDDLRSTGYAKDYTAPKPIPTPEEEKQLSRRRAWVLPMVWDAFTYGANRLLGWLVMRVVLLSQSTNSKYVARKEEMRAQGQDPVGQPLLQIAKTKDLHVSLIKSTVTTHDNAHLETYEFIHHEAAKKDIGEQEYIIYLCGNGDKLHDGFAKQEDGTYYTDGEGNPLFESDIREEMPKWAEQLKCNVVGFNYRNVGNSTGIPRSVQDLVTDGIAQVRRLLDKGVKPENITLKAHSLGGGVGALVQKHFHDRGIKINLYNDRSFSKISNVAIGAIRQLNIFGITGHSDSWYGILLSWLAWPLVKFILLATRCEMDAAAAFSAIDDDYKEYVLVRSGKEYRADRHVDDTVIPHWASLHKGLAGPREKVKKEIKKKVIDEIKAGIKKEIENKNPGTSDKQIQILLKKEYRKAVKDGVVKKVYKQEKIKVFGIKKMTTHTQGHAVPDSWLRSRDQVEENGEDATVRGHEHFNHFFKRVRDRNKKMTGQNKPFAAPSQKAH